MQRKILISANDEIKPCSYAGHHGRTHQRHSGVDTARRFCRHFSDWLASTKHFAACSASLVILAQRSMHQVKCRSPQYTAD